MDARDLFLMQHGAVHSKVVAGNAGSVAERTFSGLTDDQMKVRPREDLNSLAWLMWHIARAEDLMLNPVLTGRDQVFNDTEIITGFKDADWAGNVEPAALERAAAQGGFGEGLVKAFSNRPRAAILSGIALFHPSGHMGEAVTVRSAGGFGTGI